MRIYLFVLYLLLSLITLACVSDGADTKGSTAADIAQSADKVTQNRPTKDMNITMPGSSSENQTTANQGNAKPIDIRNVNREGQLDARSQAIKQQDVKKQKSLKANKGKELPSACNLVDANFISKVMGNVRINDILVKDGSGKNAVDARSCFFKWDDQGNPNGGVLLQIQRNPIPEEFPEWAAYYVNAKKNQGDQMPDGSGSYRYKDFPGMGVAGAYNYELSRYVWRTESDNVFMIAFNLQSAEAEQLIWAEKIGKEAMQSFEKYNKR